MRSFASKYAPSQCLVVNRTLKATVRFMTIWDLMLETPETLLAPPG